MKITREPVWRCAECGAVFKVEWVRDGLFRVTHEADTKCTQNVNKWFYYNGGVEVLFDGKLLA